MQAKRTNSISNRSRESADGATLDAVVISDLHLGSQVCQAHSIVTFLKRIDQGELATRELVLNGDVFDSIDFRRLSRHHWKVLSLLRRLSDRIAITWVCGNHDGPAEIVSQLLGVNVKEEHILWSGRERVLLLHGHTFDDFLDAYPMLTSLADLVYRILQKLDRSHGIARKAKTTSKIFLRCLRKVRELSIAYAKRKGCTMVTCGHTHHAEAAWDEGVQYFNSGCWTEKPCTYLTIKAGIGRLYEFAPSEHETESASQKQEVRVEYSLN